ncbi:MAG: hypothetical protein QXR31_06495 [Zestosphaera sp.]
MNVLKKREIEKLTRDYAQKMGVKNLREIRWARIPARIVKTKKAKYKKIILGKANVTEGIITFNEALTNYDEATIKETIVHELLHLRGYLKHGSLFDYLVKCYSSEFSEML